MLHSFDLFLMSLLKELEGIEFGSILIEGLAGFIGCQRDSPPIVCSKVASG
jgi:hypothetical protein